MAFLRIAVPFYFVISAQLVADGIRRGSGMMNTFMAAAFADLILRVVLSVTLAKTSLGYIGIWMAWTIGWSAAATLSIGFYRTGSWSEKHAPQQLAEEEVEVEVEAETER